MIWVKPLGGCPAAWVKKRPGVSAEQGSAEAGAGLPAGGGGFGRTAWSLAFDDVHRARRGHSDGQEQSAANDRGEEYAPNPCPAAHRISFSVGPFVQR